MNASNVELTQGVSQVTGPTMISTADDLLQTPRMTIEDLIEANEVSIDSIMFLCFLFISYRYI
jgi:ABC-type transport system involved in Fe-S cluster assembly fused permease/ATPase subunit